MHISKIISESRSAVRALGVNLRWTRTALSVVVALAAMTHANALTIGEQIGEAVDATNLEWTTGGNTNWFSQTLITSNNSDAAQSGVIGNNQSTWIQTTVTGPGTVSFWWKVSSSLDYDYLLFYVDGTQSVSVVGISGTVDWIQKTVPITNGVHTLKWQYEKDSSGASSSDCGWVDQVVWTPDTYTVSATARPVFAGSTTGSGNYFSGTNCTVTAVAFNGYTFTNWTEGSTVLTSSTNYTFTVLSNRTLVANFTTNSYTIATSSNPSGGGTTSGGGSQAFGSWCTLIATPNPNYTFTNWKEGTNIVFTSPNYTFQVEGSRTLVANFTPDNFTITVSSNPMGGGTTSGGGTHAYDSSCTVIAAPSTGYTFTAWTEGSSTVSTSTNYTFTVSRNRTLVANFTKINYTITTSSNPVGGGTITGAGSYEYGASCTVIATPSSSWYTFVNWTAGTNVLTSSTNYVFSVESNRTLVANFLYTRTLGHAVDAPQLTWTTGGEAGYPVAGTTNWYPQTAVTHDGVDAARSGTISDGGTSWMQTIVNGPGTVSFWWKIDTPDASDVLKFLVDSVEQDGTIVGQTDWNQKTYSIPAGIHTLRWAYVKDFVGSFAPDCGWVDQVVWTGAAISISPVYRFWSPVFSGHFFTMNEEEKNNIIGGLSNYWTYEGIAYYAYTGQAVETLPVYRFWSPVFAGHFYTMNEGEKNYIISDLSAYWTYEGIAWCAYPTQVVDTVPVYRFWSPVYAHHFFTINETEKSNIISALSAYWTYEGIAYYAFPSASRNASGGFFIPEASEEGIAKGSMGAEESSLTLKIAGTASDSQASDSGATSLQFVATPDFGDIVFPLSYLGCDVEAYVYDSFADDWICIVESTNSPASATFTGILPGRSYLVEVFSRDPASDKLTSVHRSWFEMQLDAPAQLNESLQSVIPTKDGVGSPVARIQTPVVDGTLTLKLYSSSQGVLHTLNNVEGGDMVDLSLPERNLWYWIGGWRDSDNALVLSLWLRHGTEE